MTSLTSGAGCTEADWATQLHVDEHSATQQCKVSQYENTDSCTERGYDIDELQTGRTSRILQHAGKYQGINVERKHTASDSLYYNSHVSTARVNKDQSSTDRWTTDSDWSLPLSGITDSFTSRVHAAENDEVQGHVQPLSDVFQNTVPDVSIGEVLNQTSTMASCSGLQGRDSSRWQTCVSDISEETVTRYETASMTEPRRSRGRGLMNLRQLQAAKMASERTPGRSSGSPDVNIQSADQAYRAVTPPAVSFTDQAYRAVTPPAVSFTDAESIFSARGMTSSHADTVVTASSHITESKLSVTDRHMTAAPAGVSELSENALPAGCLNTTGNSVSGSSAVHQDPVTSVQSSSSSSSLSTPAGITEPASLPATCTIPMTTYQPHMMPFTWPPPPPPPLCGIVPPGFASAAVPVMGQTLPMPYSSMPFYPAYGYQMMPGTWPFLPSAFDSVPVPTDESKDSVHKVD